MQAARRTVACATLSGLLLVLQHATGGVVVSAQDATTTAASRLDDRVVAWLGNYLNEGETRLFANDIKYIWGLTIGSGLTGNWKSLPSVCDGRPSIQTRSQLIRPNGGCPEIYTGANVSCTCLNGYANQTEWQFNVRMRPAIVTSFPLELSAADVFEINTLMTIIVPETLTSVYVFYYFFYLVANLQPRWLCRS